MNKHSSTRLALRGDLIDFTAPPALEDPHSAGVRVRPDHWLLIEDQRIVAVQAEAPGPEWPQEDHRGRWILPGFIDTHVHSAQIDVIGAWGTQLLDWLNTHTFPAEARMADEAHAQALSALFLDSLFSHGTTSAMVFPTVHKHSVDALFAAAQARQMRLITGKVLMDRHAPDFLRDDVAQAERDCTELITRWHGQGRLAYAVTPRFAPTSTDAQLAMAGALMAAHPGLYMQTHVAENRDEVRWVAELFPEARSYLDVYQRFGLLGPGAMLAHGIWLDDEDRALLRSSGAALAFCPSSNLFLGSGLFDWAAAQAAGTAVSMASDVGGGTSLSLLRTLADGYKVQAMAGRHVSAWALLHAATLGAATALGLAHEIGALEPGLMADVVVWDKAITPLEARRQAVAQDVHDAVFAWMTQGDDRHVVETWVAGGLRYRRPSLAEPQLRA
ncbi:guanine deaminase [Ideonella sp.]|jgi:guanine deaminase|uniref:guanine deaminase n=1 Tax=Ideonella sp. TaxID=1929293 RepID=UPI0037C16116